MTSTGYIKPEPSWRRWWRRLGEIEAAMDITYDDFQDGRMDRLETEVARLRAEIETLPRPAAAGPFGCD